MLASNNSYKIAMLGDSITNGCAWNELLKRTDVINRGIGGDTTTGMVRLEGRWTLVNMNDNSVVTGQNIQYHEYVATHKSVATIDEMVAMQSQMLNKLSRLIAGKVLRYL